MFVDTIALQNRVKAHDQRINEQGAQILALREQGDATASQLTQALDSMLALAEQVSLLIGHTAELAKRLPPDERGL